MMPRITTDSGKTLEDLFANLEEHAREYNDTAIKGRWLDRQAEPLNDECQDRDSVTRRGDSIVPPSHRLTLSRNRKLCTCDYDHFRGRHESNCPYYVADLPPSMQPRIWINGVEWPPITPLSHAADPHTSTQAARSMVQGAQRHRVAILTALRLFGPATGHELAARLGMEYVQVAKRLTELAADGRITRRILGFSGPPTAKVTHYQTRPSPSGRPACVWHLNPLAKSTEPA